MKVPESPIISNLLVLKKIVISSRLGIFIDCMLRLCLSAIPLVHSLVARRKKNFNPRGFVFFLYGGIGDVLMTLDLISSVEQHSKVYIFSDSRIVSLRFLFPTNANVLIYDKSTFMKGVSDFKASLGTDTVFVQTSPIIEMYFVRQILGIRHAAGLLANYGKLRAQGLNAGVEVVLGVSKQAVYADLYRYLCSIFEWSYKGPAVSDTGNLCSAGLRDSKYVVMSVMKTSDWGMGKLKDSEYLAIAEHYAIVHGLTVIFVGDSSEKNRIDKIITNSRVKGQILNSAGKTTLHSLSVLLRGAMFVISNDNGIAHLAAHLRVRVLVLFMFSDPEVYRWSGDFYQFIFKKKAECMPCVGVSRIARDNYPVKCRNNLLCKYSITHLDVLDKIYDLNWIAKA
jgi:Glycosyltransferase family 9 (heptosyltransferase)